MKKFKYKINGKEYEVAVNKVEDTLAEVEVNGTSYKVELEKKVEEVATPKIQRPVATASASKTASAGGGGTGAVKSPLPGIIINVSVKVGDTVKKGDVVAMLEAMKMENAISAPMDGKVTEVCVNPGDSVLEGVLLLVIA